MNTMGARPFIKWAGGKNQLLMVIGPLLPPKIKTYYEPLLGGGAVFWHMANTRTFERAVLNDKNLELIQVYGTIRDQPEALIAALNRHREKAWNTREYFNEIRAMDISTLDIVERSARMIYLNRTCYNGLYRVNKAGHFNTPFGDYKNPSLVDSGNIRACSEALGYKVFSSQEDLSKESTRKVSLYHDDFTKVFFDAGAGDVVYFDPPYVPISDTSNFLAYTADGFDVVDQSRLAILFRRLASMDVSCILSNSDTEIVRKTYQGFEIIPVKAKRNINSKGDSRGVVGEVLVIHRGAAHKKTQS